MKLCGRQPLNLETKTMADKTMNTEQSRVAADCPNERLVIDTEMQAHKFELGCPRCKTPFADFVPVIEKDT